MLDIKLDNQRDTVTIEGTKYSQELFRQVGGLMPLGRLFTIVERRADGTLLIKYVTTEEPDDSLRR